MSGAAEELHFLSSFLGRPAQSSKLGTSMGRVWDVVATLGELYPQVRGVVLRHRDKDVIYPATYADYMHLIHKHFLIVDEQLIRPVELGTEDVSVRNLLWDNQATVFGSRCDFGWHRCIRSRYHGAHRTCRGIHRHGSHNQCRE